MRYRIDHDLHLHSLLSSCSNDPAQTKERILEYGREQGLSYLCLTDHFWDEEVSGASGWYAPQNFSHVSRALPLPQEEGIGFFFGCETELDRFCRLGIARKTIDRFDFVIIPHTHLHMTGFTILPPDRSAVRRARLWENRLEAILNMDLPFHKIGIAHLTAGLIANGADCNALDIFAALDEDRMRALFSRAASLGVGIELNTALHSSEQEVLLRPYRIAKQCGCRFYLGSDAHHPSAFVGAVARFEEMIDALSLTEEDKFLPPACKGGRV